MQNKRRTEVLKFEGKTVLYERQSLQKQTKTMFKVQYLFFKCVKELGA